MAALAKDKTDADAVRTLELFYEYQILCAQQLSTVLQCGGVLLIGDNQVCVHSHACHIQVSNKEFILNMQDKLKKRFLCTQKRSWLDKVTVMVQNKTMNFNNAGALKITYEMLHII